MIKAWKEKLYVSLAFFAIWLVFILLLEALVVSWAIKQPTPGNAVLAVIMTGGVGTLIWYAVWGPFDRSARP